MTTLINILVGNILWWLLGTVVFGISMVVMGNMWEKSGTSRKGWMLGTCKISALLASSFFTIFAFAMVTTIIRAILKS